MPLATVLMRKSPINKAHRFIMTELGNYISASAEISPRAQRREIRGPLASFFFPCTARVLGPAFTRRSGPFTSYRGRVYEMSEAMGCALVVARDSIEMLNRPLDKAHKGPRCRQAVYSN